MTSDLSRNMGPYGRLSLEIFNFRGVNVTKLSGTARVAAKAQIRGSVEHSYCGTLKNSHIIVGAYRAIYITVMPPRALTRHVKGRTLPTRVALPWRPPSVRSLLRNSPSTLGPNKEQQRGVRCDAWTHDCDSTTAIDDSCSYRAVHDWEQRHAAMNVSPVRSHAIHRGVLSKDRLHDTTIQLFFKDECLK